jgi:hypothetical protein
MTIAVPKEPINAMPTSEMALSRIKASGGSKESNHLLFLKTTWRSSAMSSADRLISR